jgi:hypothetical protein
MFSRKKKIPDTNPATEVEYNALHTARYQMCGLDDTVYNYYNRNSQCVPRPLAHILANINDFGTIQEHLEYISRYVFRGIDETVFRNCIRDLHESGLLITKNEALVKLRSQEFMRNDVKISVATWITKDRPDSLIASIESFIANFKKYGHELNFFVSDDTLKNTESERLSARLNSIAQKQSINLIYMGQKERRKLHDAILEKTSPDGLPAEVLDFAMLGLDGISPSHGANRNTVLLANAGKMILCTDDDVFCDLRLPKYDGIDFELTTNFRSDIMESYPDRTALVQAHPSGPADLLSFHDRLLGKHIAEIIGDFNNIEKFKLKNLSHSHLTHLLTGGGFIRATVAGISGDSGLPSPRYLVRLDGTARERYTSSESILHSALRSREMFMTASHYAVAINANFPGMNFGLDNRRILPPFLPVMRGEDTIFSRMIKLISNDSLTGSLPLTITHDPEGHRMFDEQTIFNVRPVLSELILIMLDSYQPPAGVCNAEGYSNALGNHLADIGSLPLDDFEEHMKRLWLLWGSRVTENIEMLLKKHDSRPAYWAEILETYATSIREHSRVNYISAALDLYAGDERAAALSCRDIIRQYGEVLQWWPVIYDAAYHLGKNRQPDRANKA